MMSKWKKEKNRYHKGTNQNGRNLAGDSDSEEVLEGKSHVATPISPHHDTSI